MDTVNSPSQVGHELPNEEDLLNRSYYWIRRISMTQTLSTTMKAVAISRFGGIETLETQELPIPAVGADEVLVHVEAAGVGVWDPFEREGGFAKEFNIKPVFPLVLGSDGAGTVEAVGPQVKRFKKGDRVYGISFLNPKGGFFSQYAVVKKRAPVLRNFFSEPEGRFFWAGCCCERNQLGAPPGKAPDATSRCHGR